MVFQPSCKKEKLRKGFEELNGDIHFKVPVRVGVHDIYNLFISHSRQSAVQGENDSIARQSVESFQLMVAQADTVFFMKAVSNDLIEVLIRVVSGEVFARENEVSFGRTLLALTC